MRALPNVFGTLPRQEPKPETVPVVKRPAYYELVNDARLVAGWWRAGDRTGVVREIRDSARPALFATLVASMIPSSEISELTMALDEAECDDHRRKIDHNPLFDLRRL